jgi:hypothetical protein
MEIILGMLTVLGYLMAVLMPIALFVIVLLWAVNKLV